MDMNFDEYQNWAKTTAIYPDQVKGFYPLLGLVGETAETVEKIHQNAVSLLAEGSNLLILGEPNTKRERIAEILNSLVPIGREVEQIKKHYRKYGLGFDARYEITTSEEKKEEIKKELGDILWYMAAICSDFGLSLQDVAQTNHDKLESRKARNVLHGSGDNR